MLNASPLIAKMSQFQIELAVDQGNSRGVHGSGSRLWGRCPHHHLKRAGRLDLFSSRIGRCDLVIHLHQAVTRFESDGLVEASSEAIDHQLCLGCWCFDIRLFKPTVCSQSTIGEIGKREF